MNSKTLLKLLIAGLAIVLIVNFFPREEKIEKTFSKVTFNDQTWDVEVVQSRADRIRGLSGRINLEENTGMLFIFPESGVHGIWMKEMNFPIDIIWFDENFKVTGLKTNATPESFPEAFYPNESSKYILEVNALEAKKAEIKIGSFLEIL